VRYIDILQDTIFYCVIIFYFLLRASLLGAGLTTVQSASTEVCCHWRCNMATKKVKPDKKRKSEDETTPPLPIASPQDPAVQPVDEAPAVEEPVEVWVVEMPPPEPIYEEPILTQLIVSAYVTCDFIFGLIST